MPTIAIVAHSANETNDDIVRAWRELGLDAVVLSGASSLGRLHRGDTALARIDVSPSLDGVEPGLLELLKLGCRGVSVLNSPTALLCAHDKLLTARALAAAGVPHPETEHVDPSGPFPALPPPVVVKPRFGSWGADILRCDSPAEVRRALSAIRDRRWFRAHGALVQSLVPPVGHDLRILVAGGRVVGAERRVAAPGEWRTNISLGGTFAPAAVPPRARALALAAARAVGGDFVGIDLLPHRDDYVVIEANGAVDFDERYSLPGCDVFGDLASALGLLDSNAAWLPTRVAAAAG
jgi:[lysine-biosynthesis-protein LysW]--L-2-aminoadipate ligase